MTSRRSDPIPAPVQHLARARQLLVRLGCFAFIALNLFGQPALLQAVADSNAAADKKAKLAAIDAEMQAAMEKVKTIVNQPVTAVRATPQMRIGVFSPGWFHDGAIRPDFNHVDVRTTQELKNYTKYPYVTSDLNPGLAFISSQLEFNSMTKFFYVNRSVPKKRLTEAEMLEINRLYRIIGECEHKKAALAEAEIPDRPTEPDGQWTLKPIPRSRYILAGVGIAVVVGLYLLGKRRR
ncbi:hypothetical protein GC207_01505 [bacterium]|nr:hypothetical protein [bacterium]